MEKFGIFELLDTLSAILTGESGPSATQKPPAEQATEPASAAQTGRSPQDGGESVPRENPQPSASAALSSFLAHHDRVSKKIDGQ